MNPKLCRFLKLSVLGLALLTGPKTWPASALSNVEPGLEVTFQNSAAADIKDVTTRPRIALYVPQNEAPSSFTRPGRFKATWNGFLSLELKGDYRFQADLNGAVKIEINGNVVLDVVSTNGRTGFGPLIRLNKGTNFITGEFLSPASGDSLLRLLWAPKGGLALPLAATALAHTTASPELAIGMNRRLGRDLFVEHRCLRCHAEKNDLPPAPQFDRDAPAFEGIGSRRNDAWLARWILDPKAERPTARMPRLFYGANSQEQAQAAASFLASLKNEAIPTKNPAFSNDDREAGKKLFDDLHCAACHIPFEIKEDPTRLSLKHVAQKFKPGALIEFLMDPGAQYSWTGMPNFKFTKIEATQLAAFLTANALPPNLEKLDPAMAQRGKELIQMSGCLNCHPLSIENKFEKRSSVKISNDNWEGGCLAETPSTGKAPSFALTSEERRCLKLFASTGRPFLRDGVPVEFAQMQMQSLHCAECHGRFDGFPPLEHLGEKLKPEWLKAFIAGQINYKPRPWLAARMPAFPKYADGIALGMAMEHGFAPNTAGAPPVNREAAAIGQKLVSSNGGLTCIACHSIGKTSATQVFENAGINLAYVSERIQKPYFERWLRNPLALDPVTKMPAFFDDEGRSPLTSFYDGDGGKQIEALWQYIRLGDQMPAPADPDAP